MGEKASIPDKVPSHPIVPIRVEPKEKNEFIDAARKDGKALGTWLKCLARQRILEQDNGRT